MISYFLIFYIVFIYFFFACLPFAADAFLFVPSAEFTRHPEAVHSILNAILLVGAKVALSVAQIINSVKQVGFAAAIRSGNTGHRRGKHK